MTPGGIVIVSLESRLVCAKNGRNLSDKFIRLAKMLSAARIRLFILTQRVEWERAETCAWLLAAGVRYTRLMMRCPADKRAGRDVKLEMLCRVLERHV